MRLAGKRTTFHEPTAAPARQPKRWTLGRIAFFTALVAVLLYAVRWFLVSWLQVEAAGMLVGINVEVEPRRIARIRAIDVAEAQAVAAGQPIVWLDDLELTQQIESQQGTIAALEVQLDTERHRVAAETARARAILETEWNELAAESLSQSTRRNVALSKIAGLRAQQVGLASRMVEEQDLVALGALARSQLAKTELQVQAIASELTSIDQECVGLERALVALAARAQSVEQRMATVEGQLRAASRVNALIADLAAAHDELARLRLRGDEFELRAPATGIVQKIRKRVGEVALPGEPILEIADPSILQVEAYFAQMDSAYCSVGKEVSIVFGTGQRSTGRIADLRPQADALPTEYRSGFDKRRPYVVALIRPNLGKSWPGRPNIQASVHLSKYGFRISTPAAPSVPDDRLSVREAIGKIVRR